MIRINADCGERPQFAHHQPGKQRLPCKTLLVDTHQASSYHQQRYNSLHQFRIEHLATERHISKSLKLLDPFHSTFINKIFDIGYLEKLFAVRN